MIYFQCDLCFSPLAGTPVQLERAYTLAVDSQRSTRRPDSQRVSDFRDPVKFKECLVQGEYYDDYFAFFQKEIGDNGVPNTVNKFLFSGDDRG